MKKILGAAAAISMMAFAADAAVVNITGITAKWTSTTPSITTGLGTSSITWGDPATSAGQSGYDFNAAPVPMNNVAPDTAFNLGEFVHHNNPIYAPSITQATLDVAIKILIGGTQHLVNTTYTFNHLESDNHPASGVCANGAADGAGVNVNGCADRVTAAVNMGSTSSFMIGNDEYVFTFDGFKIGSKLFSEFWTTEEADNAAVLKGSYVLKSCVVLGEGCKPPVSPVPLPAAGWMLMAGIGALAAAKRKRRAA